MAPLAGCHVDAAETYVAGRNSVQRLFPVLLTCRRRQVKTSSIKPGARRAWQLNYSPSPLVCRASADMTDVNRHQRYAVPCRSSRRLSRDPDYPKTYFNNRKTFAGAFLPLFVKHSQK